jgi:hypothetical protein
MDILSEIKYSLESIAELKSNKRAINASISSSLSVIQDKVYPIALAYVQSELISEDDDYHIDGYLTSCYSEGDILHLAFEKTFSGEPCQYFVALPTKYLCENGVQLIKEDSEKKKVEIESAAKQKELELLRELKEKYEQ